MSRCSVPVTGFVACLWWAMAAFAGAAPLDYYRVKIVDQETSRGVPLVELRTRNALRFWTDSNGIAAISEPGLMNQQVFFEIQSHGYRFEQAFFNMRGTALEVVPGGSIVLTIKRLNIAERLYRVTGEGIYRDSVLTGQAAPLRHPLLEGGVVGQDTVIASPYRGKIYWCWGDTNGLVGFNLGASGATSELPGRGGLDPSVGIDLEYFVNPEGFSKPMCPFPVPGLKWMEGLTTIRDESGRERLVARYSSVRDLGYANEWGLAMFNDETEQFDRVLGWDIHSPHRSAHPFHVETDGREMIYLFPNLRVQADLGHLKDLKAYEAFTCLAAGARFEEGKTPAVDRTPGGALVYAWKADTDPVDEGSEERLIAAGSIKPEEAWFRPRSIATDELIKGRYASVCWNAYRRRWVMLVEENPGQIWYAEGDTPVGPWVYARKVVSHTKYCLYNPTQHPFFDQEDGRIIYFEGTYSDTFSGSPEKTPRYDYNQLMYRLTLSDPRLSLPLPVYRVEGANGMSRYLMREAIEQSRLWESVREVAFFAIPPDRTREGTIPLLSHDSPSGMRLEAGSTTGTLDGVVFARVLPLVEPSPRSRDLVSGTWECKATMTDGTQIEFPILLRMTGEKVTGTVQLFGESALEGTFGKLGLQVKVQAGDEGYEIRAGIEGDSLKGEWRRSDGSEKGPFEGERSKEEGETGPTSAEVPLYAFVNSRTGSLRYATDSEWSEAGYERLPDPVCRVWRNPMKVLVLDWKAKPIRVLGDR